MLDDALRTAVRGQMVADVPLGAFLSGGVDSSTVVALMQAQSARPVRTFSIGFRESDYDEADQARAVARHLGTDHTELYITPRDALSVVPRLPVIYDEPFADASQIPTYLVAELARKHVTVSLSGDGGDELFGGYSRYAWGAALHARLGGLPVTLRGIAARAVTVLSPGAWDRVFRAASPVLPAAARQRLPGDKLHKLAAALPYRSTDDLYARLMSLWPASIVLGAGEPSARPQLLQDAQLDVAETMMLADARAYLPDDILVKVDRAAMAVSLETRVPMLDHRVVELAWRLPPHLKIRGTRGKHILRSVLARYVPPELTERAKMGFSVPLDDWLRGPLRCWAEALLDPVRLRREGFFNAEPIRIHWQEHLSGVCNRQQSLWAILMFQAWLEAQSA
jgi:asparagine synthase (glutamine-hydrolysing)